MAQSNINDEEFSVPEDLDLLNSHNQASIDNNASELRALFGDLDLVDDDQEVQETLAKLHSVEVFKEILQGEEGLLQGTRRTTVQRNCFVDNIMLNH